MTAAVPTIVRFWQRVQITDECWTWTGNTDRDGYGRIKLSRTKKTVPAHRFAYELFYGPFDQAAVICHTCDNPSCVRPAHLYAGTHKTNADDKTARGRWRNGYVNATECKHGHPFDQENTQVNDKGWRVCRACSRQRQAASRARRSA